MWEKADANYLEVFWYLPGRTEENHQTFRISGLQLGSELDEYKRCITTELICSVVIF
jgi:hypothetical protein